jgi:hypothetical protein
MVITQFLLPPAYPRPAWGTSSPTY